VARDSRFSMWSNAVGPRSGSSGLPISPHSNKRQQLSLFQRRIPFQLTRHNYLLEALSYIQKAITHQQVRARGMELAADIDAIRLLRSGSFPLPRLLRVPFSRGARISEVYLHPWPETCQRRYSPCLQSCGSECDPGRIKQGTARPASAGGPVSDELSLMGFDIPT
jgi:hypothetical protein